MPTNDFLPFGSAVGANVSTQAEYAALAARANGFTAGTAVSKQLNKAWRQSSVMSATLAQFIADQSGNDVLDDGNLATIQTNLGLAIKAAIASGIPYATQVQAEAGTSTTTVMSPLRVFQAIAKVVTQATESSFGWLKIATQALVNAGADDATAVTPKKLAAAIQNQALTAFTTGGSAGALTLTPVPAIQAYASPLRFRVKFSQNSTGADTLNISGLGAKSIKQYDSTGAKVAAVFAANQLADVEYDGTDIVVLDTLPSNQRQIKPIAASVSSNAVTVTLNPTNLDFRSSTLSSGTINARFISSAISVVVPSGATLGTASGTKSRIALIAIDNSGTVELAVINLAGGSNLDETTLISTVAISAAAAASNVAYSTTARTSVPFRVVGFFDSTQAAAGTWATAPSTVQGCGGQALAALSSLGFGQTYQNMSGSRSAGITYTNSTGRPIIATVWLTAAATVSFSGLVNGVVVATFTTNNTTGAPANSLSITVPDGSTYSFTVATGVINTWMEMR